MILRAQAKQHWAGTLSLMWTILRNTLYWKKEDSTLNDSIQKIKPCRKQNNNNYLYKRVDNMSTDKRYSFELINFICCYTIIQTLFFIMLAFLADHLHINIVFDIHVLDVSYDDNRSLISICKTCRQYSLPQSLLFQASLII